MSVRNVHSTDEEFVKAFMKEVRHTEDSYGVLVEVEFFHTARAGVMGLLFVSIEATLAHNLSRPIAQYRSEFPGATARALAATLFQGACKLSQLVAEHREVEKHTKAPLVR